MRKCFVLLIALFVYFTMSGCRQPGIKITITNLTGVDILQLQMRSTGTTEWEHNLMAEIDVWASDESGEFELRQLSSDSKWDIMYIDSDGDEIVFTGLSLSNAKLLELTWGFDGDTPSIVMTRSDGAQFYAEGEIVASEELLMLL